MVEAFLALAGGEGVCVGAGGLDAKALGIALSPSGDGASWSPEGLSEATETSRRALCGGVTRRQKVASTRALWAVASGGAASTA